VKLEIKVYQKEGNYKLLKLFKESLNAIYTSRFLSKQLAKRDITAQYRQSFLGIIWAFFMPIATAAVWIFLQLSGTIKLTETGIPYPLYAFTGTLIWSILTESVNSPLQATSAARSIITKINIPKEALIISGIYKLLFNSSIKILLLLVLVFVFDTGLHLSTLLFPIAVISAILVGTTLGLFITPFGMLYSDIAKITGMGFNFLMFLTPVVYAIPEQGLMKTIMEINPLTPILSMARAFLTGMEPEFLFYFVALSIVSIPLLALGLILYRISIPIIIER
jgi:lipopolysaccharide transport system permease protein